MKKICKVAVSLVVAVMLTVSVFCFNVSAASATISLEPNQTTLKVGDKITVTCNFDAGVGLFAIDNKLEYDTALMKHVSGGTNSENTVKWVEALSGETSYSCQATFEAIAEGRNYFKFVGSGSDGNEKIEKDAGVIVTIEAAQSETPSKSTNANLSSLSVNTGSLTPKFSANTTDYNVTVPNSTSKITISAAAADSKATFEGVGSFDLKVGKNTRVITVTAESGDKKSYTVNITRQEESSDPVTSDPVTSDPVTSDPNNTLDPLNVVATDGSTRKIIQDISQVPVPLGFVASSETVDDLQIGKFVESNGNENYVLYATTDDNGEDMGYYYKTDSGYKRLAYIVINNNMYIAETPQGTYSVPEGYYESTMGMNGTTATVFKFSESSMADFCIIYCYANGEYGFYRFDSLETTIQRAPDFSLSKQTVANVGDSDDQSIVWRFNNMTTGGKAIVIIIAICAILIVAAVVLIIVKLFINKPEDDDDEGRFEAVDNEYSSYDFGNGSDINISSFSNDGNQHSDDAE